MRTISRRLRDTGVLDVLDAEHVTADKGYVGSGRDTPYKNNVVRGGWRTGRYREYEDMAYLAYRLQGIEGKIVMVINVVRKLLFFHAPE